MEPIRTITSPTIVLDRPDIDTDQIIPARFLTTTTRDGLGRHLFASWRYDESGEPIASHPLNAPGAADAQILVAGRNFGCGSSREHAAWALQDFGFRAVISTRFADIFRSNAIRNGLLPVVIDEDAHARLLAAPGRTVTVDLERTRVSLPGGGEAPFEIDTFARRCLLDGVDELGYLLSQSQLISQFERRPQWTR